MKRNILILCIISSILVSCNNSTSNSTQQIVEKSEITSSESTETTTLKEPKYKTLNVGDTVKTENKEITINNVELVKEVHPPKKDGYYNYYKSDEGEIYVHISTSVKNLEKQTIFCDEIMDVVADYNEGYTYSGFSTVEDKTLGFTYSNISGIDPLITQNIHYIISCPEEVKDNTEAPLFLIFNIENEEYKLIIR